jgi:hypothetical protein
MYNGVQLKYELPTYEKLIGRCMTAPPLVLSPSSILPPPLPHWAFLPARKISTLFPNVIISISLFLVKLNKPEIV